MGENVAQRDDLPPFDIRRLGLDLAGNSSRRPADAVKGAFKKNRSYLGLPRLLLKGGRQTPRSVMIAVM